MIPIGPEEHVRPADLLRFVDGEGTAAFLDRVTAHLAVCANCTAAFHRLQSDSAHVLNRLSVLDEVTAIDKLPPTFAELAQRRTRGRTAAGVIGWRGAAARVVGWRAAAGIILFMGVGAAIARPVAAWLDQLIGTGQASENVTAIPPVAEGPALARVDTMSAAYSFTPASNELRIDFAGAEPDAELMVRAYDENGASFELQSTAALPPVLILPNAVRITNGTNRGTHYELALPRNVHVLIVTIADGAERRVLAGSLPARIRLNE
jgi:hypothetical protein